MKSWQTLATGALIAGLSLVGAADKPKPGSSTEKPHRMTLDPTSGNDADASFVMTFATRDKIAPQEVRVLINAAIDGRNACYVFYGDEDKQFRLVKNSGSESFSREDAEEGKLQNAQCVLDLDRASAEFKDGTLTLRLALHFKSAFKGKRNVYLWMRSLDGHASGFQLAGTWRVPHGMLLQGTAN